MGDQIIKNRFLHYEKKAQFEQDKTDGKIVNTHIVFIKDTGEIWTHGTYYGGDVPLPDNIEQFITTVVKQEIKNSGDRKLWE